MLVWNTCLYKWTKFFEYVLAMVYPELERFCWKRGAVKPTFVPFSLFYCRIMYEDLYRSNVGSKFCAYFLLWLEDAPPIFKYSTRRGRWNSNICFIFNIVSGSIQAYHCIQAYEVINVIEPNVLCMYFHWRQQFYLKIFLPKDIPVIAIYMKFFFSFLPYKRVWNSE